MRQRRLPRSDTPPTSLLGDYPYLPGELRFDVGRSDQGSFIRVVHLPTNRARFQAGLFGEPLADIQHKLLALLHAESMLDASDIRIDHGMSGFGRLFIRIRHLPSGCMCSATDVEHDQHAEIERQLLHQLAAEVATMRSGEPPKR
jgi:hypothetical protein